MKRLLTVLLAICAAALCTAMAFADDPLAEEYFAPRSPFGMVTLSPSQAFQLNLDNTNTLFDEYKTAPTWLFSHLKEQGAGASMTLKADLYHLTFYAADVKEPLITGPRYNLELTLQSKNMGEHDTYFGLRTPKFEITLANKEQPLPTSKVVVTLPVGRFIPNSKYHVYKAEGSGKYTSVHEDLTVPADGSLSFELYERGTYLLSNGKLGDHKMTFRTFPTIEELRNMPIPS